MNSNDLRDFITLGLRYKETLSRMQELVSENERAWTRNGWRASYEEYIALLADLPSGGNSDEMMREMHPSVASTYDMITHHSVEFAAKRNELVNSAHLLVREALAELGRALSPILVSAVERKVSSDFMEILEAVYRVAELYRAKHLDGVKTMAFDGNGPFMRELLKPVATMLGIDIKHRNWPLETIKAYQEQSFHRPFDA